MREYGELDFEALRAFEDQKGVTLPTSYRQFLFKYNGGIPERASFELPGNPCSGFIVQGFFGCHAGPATERLGDVNSILGGRLRSDMVAIARDGTGAFVTLSLGTKNRGNVFFWEEDNSESTCEYCYLARSVWEFFEQLEEVRDEYSEHAFMLAGNGNLEELKELIGNGCPVNLVDQIDGNSLLEEAVRKNQLDIAKYLISEGATIGRSEEIVELNYEFFPEEFEAIREYIAKKAK